MSEPNRPRASPAARSYPCTRRARRRGYELRDRPRRGPGAGASGPGATGRAAARPGRAPPGSGHPRAPAHLGRGTPRRGRARAAVRRTAAPTTGSARPATCSRPSAGRSSGCSSSLAGRSAGGGSPSRPGSGPWPSSPATPASGGSCTRTRRTRGGPRGLVLLAAAVAVAVAVRAAGRFAPWWGWVLLAAVAAAAAGPGRAPGGQADHPPGDDHAAVPGAERRRRAARLLRGRARPPGQARPADHVRRRRCPATATGPGCWSTCRTARAWTTRSKARPAIASGLDVTAVPGVHPPRPDQPPRHVLWVADRDPLAVPVGRTPLLACKATDIWKPAPIGPRRARPAGHRAADVELGPGRRAAPGGQDVLRPAAGPVRGAGPVREAVACSTSRAPRTGGSSRWSPTGARSGSPRPGTACRWRSSPTR